METLSAFTGIRSEHAPALEKLKKTDLATRAEALMANTGWLPVPLRITSVSGADSDAEMTAEAAE